MEAASGLMNVAMMPMWIVSGVFFSADRFPAAFQPVIKALPLTAVIDALRATCCRRRPGGRRAANGNSAPGSWSASAALKLFRWR